MKKAKKLFMILIPIILFFFNCIDFSASVQNNPFGNKGSLQRNLYTKRHCQ